MIEEIQNLIDEYTKWLKDKTRLRQVDDWVEVTTPYLDRHNDYLQIYARRENGRYLLTDDGYTIQDLKLSGCNLDTKKRIDLLQMTLNGFGIKREGDALITHATVENFALKKHNLLQAMLAVNDLFYLAVPIVSSLFLEDVIEWLHTHDIRHTQNVKFTGASGYDHLFDFVIPASRKQPERILKAINRPNRETAESFAFAWIDTRTVRPSDSKAYAVLNDSERDVSALVLEALQSYEIHPIVWGRRDQFKEELAA